MEDWYSAYSEPCGSEMSSEYGYVTANEDVESRRLSSISSWSRRSRSRVGEEAGEPECRRVRFSTDNYGFCERTDIKDILHMLYTLNDCIWCTNLFVMERDQEGSVKAKGTCSRKRKYLYTSEDADKELNYIDFVLDRMLEKILHVMENCDYGYDFILLKDTVESSRLKKEPEDSVGQEDKAKEADKMLPNGNGHLKNEAAIPISNAKELPAAAVNTSSKDDETVNLKPINDPGPKTMNGATDIANTTYVFPTKKDDLPLSSGEMGRCEPSKTVAVAMINEISWKVDVYKKQLEINEKIKVANCFLGIISGNGALDEDIKSVNEALSRKKNVIPDDVQLTTGPGNNIHCCKSGNPLKVTNIDTLLFEKEKWRITVVERNGGDPMEHLEGIALPIDYDSFKNDTRATYYGLKRKNLLSISLQTTDMSEKIYKTMFNKVFAFFMLLLSITLYFSDLVSDLILAVDHYSNGNKDYAGLTLLFVFAPFIADTLSKLILKALGWDKEYGKLKWKDVFSFNDFKIIKWMASSVKYALNSMKNYQVFAPCYADLHSYRCQKGKKEYRTNAAEDESEKADCYQIHTVFSSMLAWNERFTLQTKLAECLNESAPQLLLQLTIVIRQFVAGHQIGFKSWFSIVTSVLSLSWSIHVSHFNRHYHTGGRVLNNSYEWSGRIMEFIGNCFVYGSRLASICLVTSVLGAWAILGSMLYLFAIYFIMITRSGRKEIYKTLHRYKTTIFWPLHRLFTVPYRIGIWRMDSVDHLLYYIEIICLALSLPALLPTDYDKNIAWIAAGVVLSLEALGIAVLYIFKRFFHPYGYVCENR